MVDLFGLADYVVNNPPIIVALYVLGFDIASAAARIECWQNIRSIPEGEDIAQNFDGRKGYFSATYTYLEGDFPLVKYGHKFPLTYLVESGIKRDLRKRFYDGQPAYQE